MRWRPWLYVLHRDVGYLCLGLTVVYAVSGVAVNHRHHWDYDYTTEVEHREVGRPAALLGEGEAASPGELARARQDELVGRIAAALGKPGPPRAAFWRGPDLLSLFFGEGDADVADYEPSTGRLVRTWRRPRFLIRAFNVLHLNEHRHVWTWFADGYAVLLLFLAVSGTVMVRGRRGLSGRGGVLALLGVAVPVLALWLLAG